MNQIKISGQNILLYLQHVKIIQWDRNVRGPVETAYSGFELLLTSFSTGPLHMSPSPLNINQCKPPTISLKAFTNSSDQLLRRAENHLRIASFCFCSQRLFKELQRLATSVGRVEEDRWWYCRHHISRRHIQSSYYTLKKQAVRRFFKPQHFSCDILSHLHWNNSTPYVHE